MYVKDWFQLCAGKLFGAVLVDPLPVMSSLPFGKGLNKRNLPVHDPLTTELPNPQCSTGGLHFKRYVHVQR